MDVLVGVRGHVFADTLFIHSFHVRGTHSCCNHKPLPPPAHRCVMYLDDVCVCECVTTCVREMNLCIYIDVCVPM